MVLSFIRCYISSGAFKFTAYCISLCHGFCTLYLTFNFFLGWIACLNEDSYPVQGGSVSSNKIRNRLTLQHSLDKGIGNSQSVPSTSEDLNSQAAPSIGFADSDLEATLSQNVSSAISDPPVFAKEGDFEKPTMQPKNEINLDGFVANDSQSEDGDLYLSECRILLVGFEVSEMRKLVSMVRRGGGSRYMSFNDKLTHIVVGSPSEM